MSSTVEIIAGIGIDCAFEELKINATQKYCNKQHGYEVWELSNLEYHRLKSVRPKNWKPHYGWFVKPDGIDMWAPDKEFIINGHAIMAWKGGRRLDLLDVWNEESPDVKAKFYNSFKEYENCYMPYKFNNILDYVKVEMHIDAHQTVCTLLVSLAEANKITLTEMFETYLG